MNFYKIALLLVVSFFQSAQGEGCHPPPCAHGQFFCTHHGTDCCKLDSEFCSPETKHCERALYNVPKGHEIMACCTFLTEEKGEDADYQRGSFKEGKLQVCKHLLGALTWERTCANSDKGTTAHAESTTAQPESTTAQPESTTAHPESTTAQPESTTAQPESSRSSATKNNPDITTRDASREGQGTLCNCPDCNCPDCNCPDCNCPDCNCYTFVMVIIELGVIIVLLLVCARSCLSDYSSALKKKINKIICGKHSSNIEAEVPTEEEIRSGIPGCEESEPRPERRRTGNVPADGLNRDKMANSSARFRRPGSQEDSSSKSNENSETSVFLDNVEYRTSSI